MDFLVRASQSDNRLIEELATPATTGLALARRVPMDGIVVDAPTARSKPVFRDVAQAAGLPFLIDPLTHLLLDVQSPEDSWASLDFAHPEAASLGTFEDGRVLDELIDRTLRFQLEHGATHLIPPYIHAKSPDDPWFGVQLAIFHRTGAYLRAEGIDLPVAAVLAGALQHFGPRSRWAKGLDLALSRLETLNVRLVALALSASRSTKGDSPDRVANYLAAVHHVAATHHTIAWRQGTYGLAAVAAGASGYQAGPGTDESCDLPSATRSRRPRTTTDNFGRAKRIYMSRFGRSISAKAAHVLLSHASTRGGLVCNDAMCCPDGASSMLSNWRQHTLRARARDLYELRALPDAAWRLNQVSRHAERAATDARMANEVLQSAGLTERIPERSYRALAEVADAIRAETTRRAG